MKAYTFDANGKFTGETVADPCQVTDKKIAAGEKIERVWLLPYGSTLIAPVIPDGKEAIFNGEKWEYSKIIAPKEENPRETEEKPEQIAKKQKLNKAISDLKKVNVANLSLEEMRVVIGDLLVLIAPKD